MHYYYSHGKRWRWRDLILSDTAGHLVKWYALISRSTTQTPPSDNIWRLLDSTQVQMDLLWRMGRRSHTHIFSNRACGASDFRFGKVYATNKLPPTPTIFNRKRHNNNENIDLRRNRPKQLPIHFIRSPHPSARCHYDGHYYWPRCETFAHRSRWT